MESAANTVFLSLGSNQGDREKYLKQAIERLCNFGDIQKISSIWETAAWGKTDQDNFLNMVVQLQTGQEPLEFLGNIQHIENELGRVRTEKWGVRTIDIDVVLWNEEEIDIVGTDNVGIGSCQSLQIPHPFAHERAFVLAPLLEIAPDIVFPNGISGQEYWEKLPIDERESVMILS